LAAALATISVGKSITDAGVQLQALTAKMNAATGSADVAAASMRYVREEANRLGLDFRATADGFASFAASGLRSGLTFEQIQSIFTGVSEAASAMRLSTERTSLVFTALSQMASKGTVSMEELKQQLGESLPGALQIFAKAMGKPNDEFIKMIENGQVTTRDLIKLGEGLRKDFGAAAEEAASGAQAAFNRFGNAVFDLQTKLASSGLLDVVVQGVESLTNALNDPQLVAGLSALVNFLAKTMEFALKAASAIGLVVSAVGKAAAAMSDATFGTSFSEKAQQAASKPVRIAVTPSSVDPNYTLGKMSTPGVSDAARRAQEARERLRQQVQTQSAGLINEMDPNKTDSAKATASLNKRYEEEQELLEKALAKKAITEQEFREESLKVELDYQARLAEIRRQYREEYLTDQQAAAEGFLGIELDTQDKSIQEQGQSFRESIAMAAQHNRAFFALEKAAAIARALLAARQSVVDAYRFGNSLGGPILGAAFAATAAAAQATNIAAIASTSFGGGGGNVSSSGGGGVGSGDGGSADTGAVTVPKKSEVVVRLEGADVALWSKNDVRKLIDRLNDAGADNSPFTFVTA
jgi:tape measure domain-containing protein